MTQALARTTSLSASALLVGLCVIGAFSISYTIMTPPADTPSAEIVFAPPRDPDPPTPQPIAQPLHAAPSMLQSPEALVAPPTDAFTEAGDVLATIAPVEIAAPRWLRRPHDLGRYYPPRALAREVEGFALLDCGVRVDGALACAVVEEAPAGWGFGQAALQIAGEHRMAPALRNGAPVEGHYRMRVPFQVR